MFTGTVALDLLLRDVHSLKEKRAVVRPIVAQLRRSFECAAAEAGHLDDAIRRVEGNPQITVLSSRQRLYALEDE